MSSASPSDRDVVSRRNVDVTQRTGSATAAERAAGTILAHTGFLVGRDPSPHPELAVELSRSCRVRDRREEAVAWLQGALRADGWASARLWTELVALMEEPADYAAIRELWYASPVEAHYSIPILRSVARGACVAGEHDEARTLLRKAILLEVRRIRTNPRLRIKRLRAVRGLRRVQRRKNASKDFQEAASQALVDLNRVLTEMGVRPFLLGGTLLGVVRDGALLSWDKDIDIGVFADEVDPQMIERALALRDEFSVRRLDLTSERLRVNHLNGVMIDIFPHYKDDCGLVWHAGAATRWWNTPFKLKPVEFLGVEQFVPDNPEDYLEESYGEWRKPDPNFDARLDKPNVEITDQAYFDTTHFYGLLDALVKGNVRKKRRFIALLRDIGEGEWLDRL